MEKIDYVGFMLTFGQFFITIVALVLAFRVGNSRLLAYFEDRPHLKFRRQLIQLAGGLIAILFLILFLPFGDTLRGQLLSLYGLIVSAAIALSSTTLVGNVMAGIMLKTIGSCRPGNYITVGDYFGRISEMDLLHTEIQTEERDLTTLPNMYLVTNPVRVMRATGTVLFVELSLGYEVSRHKIEKILLEAARACELDSPYVQIRNLGDYSVTYRVSGLLKEVNRLLDKRRELRGRTIDGLHENGVEIVSPSFMNTRALEKDRTFISEVEKSSNAASANQSTDSLVFDKAEKAASVARLREMLAEANERLKACKELIASESKEQTVEATEAAIQSLVIKIERLTTLINRKEAQISEG